MQALPQPTQPEACPSGAGNILSNRSREPLFVLGDGDTSVSSAPSAGYVFGSPAGRHLSGPQMNSSDPCEPLAQFARRAYIFQPDDDPRQGDYHDPWHLAPKSAPASTRSRCLPFLQDHAKAPAPSLTRVLPLRRLLGFTQDKSRTVRTPTSDDGDGKRARECRADPILKGTSTAGRSLEPSEAAQARLCAEHEHNQQQDEQQQHERQRSVLQLHPPLQFKMQAQTRPFSGSTTGSIQSLPYIAEDLEEGPGRPCDAAENQ